MRSSLLCELDVMSPETVWLWSAVQFWDVLVGTLSSLFGAVALSDWTEAGNSDAELRVVSPWDE